MVERLRGRAGQEQRARRLARTRGLCERCGASGIVRRATIVNHIVPLIHGGPDTDENTENLCRPCDKEVTAEQFGHRKRVEVDRDGWPIGPRPGEGEG